MTIQPVTEDTGHTQAGWLGVRFGRVLPANRDIQKLLETLHSRPNLYLLA